MFCSPRCVAKNSRECRYWFDPAVVFVNGHFSPAPPAAATVAALAFAKLRSMRRFG